jgi:mono/diheme cytochrome c family protein
MTILETTRRGVMALTLLGLALTLAQPGRAETAEEKEEAAQLAEAERAFRDHVEPFVKSYCVECHGDRPKAGLNLKVAVRKPGDPA